MTTAPSSSGMIGLCHTAMSSRNPAALAEFYRDVVGMQIVGGSDASHRLGASAFLSSRPDEECHELAIFADSALAHQAFRVKSLAELRQFRERIVERGIPIKMEFHHGVSIAFYFDDPEGNMIEVYWSTGVNCPQPHLQELDWSKSDEELLDEVRALANR